MNIIYLSSRLFTDVRGATAPVRFVSSIVIIPTAEPFCLPAFQFLRVTGMNAIKGLFRPAARVREWRDHKPIIEFLAGTPPELIMKISGHKSLHDFYKYIRITPEEAGRKIQEIWEQRGEMQAS